MSSSCFGSDQIKEVSSWIHDERKCVSIGAVSQSLGLSRTQAQVLLQQVPKAEQHSYQATKCVVSEEEENTNDEAIKTTGKLAFVLTLPSLKLY
jgi:hypothetical protein